MNLNDIVKEVILEEKESTLKLFYNIDVFLQEFKDEEPEEETPVAPVEPVVEPVSVEPTQPVAPVEPVAAPTPAVEDSPEGTENLLIEQIIKSKVKGELVVAKEDALNIQTVQDLIDYLSDKKHTNQSIVEKVLDKKGTKKSESIISPVLQEVILVLMGNGEKELGDVIDKGDKVIVDIDYGANKTSNIGFKINKNAGTDVFSVMLKKDGKILPGKFDQTLLNKRILFYRNSLEA